MLILSRFWNEKLKYKVEVGLSNSLLFHWNDHSGNFGWSAFLHPWIKTVKRTKYRGNTEQWVGYSLFTYFWANTEPFLAGFIPIFQYYNASNKICLISSTLPAGLNLLNYFALVKIKMCYFTYTSDPSADISAWQNRSLPLLKETGTQANTQ